MNNYEEQLPFLLFMHIYKTGGTTIRSVVDRQFGEKNVLIYSNNVPFVIEGINGLIDNPNTSHEAMIGHFRYGIHKYIHRCSKYITWLRNPIERGISQYYYDRHHAFLNKQLNAPSQVAATFAEELEVRPQAYSNIQLKFLTGMEDGEIPDAKDLLRSHKIIEENFIALGITEYLIEFVLLISKKFGWKPVRFAHLNSGQSCKVAPATLEKLATLNALDIELYELVNRRFESLVNEQGDDFHQAKIELAKNVAEMEAGRTTNLLRAEFTYKDMPAVSSYLG